MLALKVSIAIEVQLPARKAVNIGKAGLTSTCILTKKEIVSIIGLSKSEAKANQMSKTYKDNPNLVAKHMHKYNKPKLEEDRKRKEKLKPKKLRNYDSEE